MPREAEPSLNEKAFVLQALGENLRLDDREFDQYRPIELTFGAEHGNVDVSFGQTRVLVKVSAEVVVPFPDRPQDGIFQIAVELSPMISPAIEVNRPTEAEVLLSRLLEKTVRRSGALDTESLCLIAGRKVWCVRADVHILSHDGNLPDAACLALVAALRHFRKPDTTVEGEVLTVYTSAEREPVPLSWLHSPFCVTFSFFGDEGETILVDATLLEEQLRSAACTISMNKHGEISQVAKLGGTPVEAVSILQCGSMAVARVKYLSDFVDKKLAEDAKRRDKGGLLAELTAENDR